MERIAKSPAGPFVAQAFRPPAGRRGSPDGLRTLSQDKPEGLRYVQFATRS